MLDSYHEEVRKKRNNHAIFWGVVFVFWILLFMFFQGYYFSISVWFEQLLHKNSQSEPKPPLNQILKSFGIVNLKVSPTPKIFTLNNEPYTNGDNKFVDYGEYELKVEEPGYIPLTLNINLSRNHAFYLNTIRLFKNPNEKIFERPTQKIEKLGAGFLSFESSGKIFQHPTYTSTGRLINSAMIRTSSWEIIKKISSEKSPHLEKDTLFTKIKYICSISKESSPKTKHSEISLLARKPKSSMDTYIVPKQKSFSPESTKIFEKKYLKSTTSSYAQNSR